MPAQRYQDALKAKLRLMFNAPDIKTARSLLDDIVSEYAQKAPRAVSCLEAGFEDAMAVMTCLSPIDADLHSTNGLERLNREVRRRERVIGIFPNTDSALRFLGALLMEQDEEADGAALLSDGSVLGNTNDPRVTANLAS
jgi:putative transposase